MVAGLRDEVVATRRTLERETVTAQSLDEALERVDDRLDRLPSGPVVAAPEPPPLPHVWRLGERARSRAGTWEGRITALERGGQRASLETGGMRVTVDVADLEPALEPAGGERSGSTIGDAVDRQASRDPASAIARLRMDRARSVAASLDLRGARVDEALDALSSYLDDASLAGMDKVTIIHGHGTGALRDAVRTTAAAHPLAREVRPGERGEGGDGATIIRL
jgi:DNA mismatch repair protein MutS2